MKALALLFVLSVSCLTLFGQSQKAETRELENTDARDKTVTEDKHQHSAPKTSLLDPYNPKGTVTPQQKAERERLAAKEQNQLKALKAKQED